MIRFQIQLTEPQAEALRRRARLRGVSVAAVVRDAVERELRQGETDPWQRARSAIGAYHGGGGNVAEEHDRFLDDAFGTTLA